MKLKSNTLLRSAVAATSALVFQATAFAAEPSPVISTTAPAPGWLERDTLTGDWGGGRTWLQEHGVSLKPRLTQFYQGLKGVSPEYLHRCQFAL